jgi:hypothetical protein
MNEKNQSDVGYQTSGTEERSKPTGSNQFKGKKMPQGNTMKKDMKGKKEEKKEKGKKEMPKKKGMSMVSDERIEKHAKRMKKGG